MTEAARQFIQVGAHRVELPTGISVNDWALEKVSTQNPRIRAYLVCNRLLEEILDSNYAILHCSPMRLLELWAKVRKICRYLRSDLGPNLEEGSCIPTLERARLNALTAFQVLGRTALETIEARTQNLPAHELPAVRRLLCVSIGKVYSFQRDTFSEIMAADPRSSHNADYYLSKRFPQDIEDSEWLYATVRKLTEHLQDLEPIWTDEIRLLTTQMERDRAIPSRETWSDVETFLNLLVSGLAPRLKEVVALRGIRFDEIEPMDEHTFGVPHVCRLLVEIYGVGRQTVDRVKTAPADTLEQREQRVAAVLSCHQVTSEKLGELLLQLESRLRDLTAYVPLWLGNIERRRALMLSNLEDAAAAPGQALT